MKNVSSARQKCKLTYLGVHYEDSEESMNEDVLDVHGHTNEQSMVTLMSMACRNHAGM